MLAAFVEKALALRPPIAARLADDIAPNGGDAPQPTAAPRPPRPPLGTTLALHGTRKSLEPLRGRSPPDPMCVTKPRPMLDDQRISWYEDKWGNLVPSELRSNPTIPADPDEERPRP
jgi:hypothetical protein